MRTVVHIAGTADRGPSLEDRLASVAQGDHEAFSHVYDAVIGAVLGVARRVVRDLAQSEEVAQEVMLDVWRTAARFRPDKGSAMTWILTMAHHRAVDRVRSAQAATDREHRTALRDHSPEYDEVVEEVEHRLEREQVRRCLGTLTELQRQSVTLAYYRGCTHREVAGLLAVPLGTIKTRLRDGLIRMRDCLGVGT
ncbi:ECF RNA polymerase sigma factor SigK [Streptomyces sp. SID3343]|uniref:ECF RNA polymerase sigma factor SigK n=1 Tax=Streptomyces sp. SID3343 TaxID=2690260 RepID=UPI00136DB685|nr:ECF RNA polymerase sigma factor SigK [Streptomyces sp. SID3343]MYW00274.1 sigma-70 family RNA polymerase sigma factor [Streptomyces sp. SID3343]